MHEAGIILRYGLLISCLEIGDVAKLLYQTHLGTVASSSPSEELLPLPVAKASVEEARVLQAMKDGISASRLRQDFSELLPAAGRGSWLFLLVTLLNYMNKGRARPSTRNCTGGVPANNAQLHCLRYLFRQ